MKTMLKHEEKIKELNMENKEIEQILINQLDSDNKFPPKLKICKDHEKS